MPGWLVHNPVAELPIPQFLVLYGLVIAASLAWCWLAVRRLDGTAGLPVPPIPDDADPYEIAYLRGGRGEVVRVGICALVQRGFLNVEQADNGIWWARRRQPAPDPRS
jgi:uncharacterized protein (TIGR04222 family)